MKRCFKCGDMKPLAEFYRHPQMGDGHLNKCKDCTKRDSAEREARIKSTPDGLAAERARGREKYHRLGYAEKYRGRPGNQAAWQQRHPEKRRAHNAVNSALRCGRLTRPEACEDCGVVAQLHGHHQDYGKPLDVNWLCAGCHGKRHRKLA